MGLEALVYLPPMEDETAVTKSWDKDTIRYMVSNKKKVMRFIKSSARCMCKSMAREADIEDIYSETLEYLYNSEDYSLYKAAEFGSNGTIISLDGYVHSCIKNCIKRYITNMYATEKDLVYGINCDDKELDPFFNVEDEQSSRLFDNILYNLNLCCKQYECYRYKYGIDLYMLLYIRLLTYDKCDETYKNILDVLGVNKRELAQTIKRSTNEDIMSILAKCVAVVGIDKSIEIIKKYVYSADKILNATLQII